MKAELLSEIRDSQRAVTWPVEASVRTVTQLRQQYDLLRQKEDEKQKRQAAAKARREADKAEKQRQARMIEMQSAPDTWLKKASKLVAERGTDTNSKTGREVNSALAP